MGGQKKPKLGRIKTTKKGDKLPYHKAENKGDERFKMEIWMSS